MESNHHHETRRPEFEDVAVNTANLEAALGRRWSSEDSRRILRCTNLILIEGSISSGEYHQVLEDQIRQHLTELLGQNYKDYLVQDVLLLCQLSARDQGFLQISTNRCRSDGEGDEDDELSSGREILNHLTTRSCDDEDTCYMAGDEDADAEICSICLEYLYQQHGTIATLKCWHEYHAGCIEKWFLRGQTFCPMCKKDATRHIDSR